MSKSTNERHYAPATTRNRDPILNILRHVLPPTGTVLEISSGTGEHAVYFAPRLAPHRWLPSDPNPIARESIEAWRSHEVADNLYPAIALDASAPVWSIEQPQLPEELQNTNFKRETISAIVNINMIHIAPWSACLGLMSGAKRLLPHGGILYLYGPFKQNGKHTASSNAAFDESLRRQNSEWGVRDLDDVIAVARAQQLLLLNTYEMPANNLSVVFHVSSTAA
ncbi:DUF938 domain-containing protein [Myxacorys almedinensis]|uniref:DUF938 domain-containing protein n=1 Tax=Myxacorys almedinensis A TaxID=2690445 RepID=A0A8J7Z1A4_9CYAN|nr:DUF938 domain-containing protein [Myxacorys almedinensis]NDJ16336.1 DUF938 domain-containing protein [Myxacorys almedinensis A]